MKQEFPIDNTENSKRLAMEKVKDILPDLTKFHDIFEDRSIMANREIADIIASKFTTAGVEVFSDFAQSLKEAKMRQSEK